MTRTLILGAYLVILVLAVLAEVVAQRNDRRVATLGALLDSVLADPAASLALIVFWWWLGWHFLVGQTIDLPPER